MFGRIKRKVFIVFACRTPIGNFGGMFKYDSAVDLGATALHGVMRRVDANNEYFLGSYDFMRCNVFMGNVLSAGLGQNPARQAAHKAGFSWESPCVTINKVCGSGMQAIICAYDAIKSGRIDLAFAGGMESMTNSPYFIRRQLEVTGKGNSKLMVGDMAIDFGKDAFCVDSMMRDGLSDAYGHRKMVEIADECAKRFGISRGDQDEYAKLSNERAIHAFQNRMFENEIVPVENFFKDEGMNKFNPEKILTLNPICDGGSITAASASKISDGAAALMIASEEIVERFGITPIAEIVDTLEYGGLPEEFPIAPSRAIGRLLEQNKLILKNIGLFEINEAFAVVPLIAIKTSEIPIEKINIHGGAVALGHPIGASGARIVVTLVHALSSKELGIASVCIGGGEALAMLVRKV